MSNSNWVYLPETAVAVNLDNYRKIIFNRGASISEPGGIAPSAICKRVDSSVDDGFYGEDAEALARAIHAPFTFRK